MKTLQLLSVHHNNITALPLSIGKPGAVHATASYVPRGLLHCTPLYAVHAVLPHSAVLQYSSTVFYSIPYLHSLLVRYRCTTVPLYRCTAVPLYHCTAVPLYHRSERVRVTQSASPNAVRVMHSAAPQTALTLTVRYGKLLRCDVL
jgi:hypothetical protein